MENKFTIVTFNPNGDYVQALYINGILYRDGDEYHSHISTWIKAFIGGCEYSGMDLKVERIDCNNEELNESICELANPAPKELDYNKLK